MLEFLRVADEYILEEVKLECEARLVQMLTIENFHLISSVAENFNADRLREYCNWFFRRYSTEIRDFD
jgi:hypothetical protein